ncbi:MAG: transposase [Elusimicrobia bacterium]|nr:transposase [Elusimicrobiota bacterium]
MPRYKEANYAQGQFVSISSEHQIASRQFQHALCYVIDHKINMSAFDALRKNDDVGARLRSAGHVKIVLAAYARGMISSRDIAFACEQNVVFLSSPPEVCRTLRPSRSSSVKWACD